MSKGNHYSEAKCPFYKSDNDGCIICEGINGKSIIKLAFINKQELVHYFKAFCGNQYKRCIIGQALESKYRKGGDSQ